MCNAACIEFGRAHLKEDDVRGKSVLEVGSLDVNGSLRPIVEAFHPAVYIGVDFQMGPGVDQICDANDILDRFGHEAFDILISTELLEHVRDWRKVVTNFKHILKSNGILLITTRSKGFLYHGYPFDYWRYEISDMQKIFSDFVIESLEKDPSDPGVFLKARKSDNFIEIDLKDYQLYSIVNRKHTKTITKIDIYLFNIRWYLLKLLPTRIRIYIRNAILKGE